MPTQLPVLKTVLLTVLTLIAFAANSLLTRMALGAESIDAASFITLRLASGAFMLWAIALFSNSKPTKQFQGKWTAALMLFIYAVAFSFAYLQLTAGTGALILFGTVQITMIATAVKQGETPQRLEWIGVGLAIVGLGYLFAPGLEAPPIVAAGLMVIAGVAWGFYSILGRGTKVPIAYTTINFTRAVPFALGVSLVSMSDIQISKAGIILALLSGAIASGVGYAIWYAALKGLTGTQAATVQLAVPILAALGGIFFLQEVLTLRLVIASVMILGGIGVTVLGRR
ncbi:MAG: DMT family transporter [Cyanobacteria bacterium P01_E01_bin.6]